MSKIQIKNLCKSFNDKKVLEDISLEIDHGAFTVILGPSGCGKSTLLRILSGLETADQGEIYIDEKEITGLEAKDRQLAMVFQNYALYPHMSVEENIGYSLKIQKIKPKTRIDLVENAIKTVQLQEHKKKKPYQLSGGQRQRVALARAIVKKPKAFLMDEPLSNLDAKLRVEMRGMLMDLHARLKTNFIYVTHDQIEALTMADKILLLNDGKIMQYASPKEMYTDPQNVFVAGFIGAPSSNIFTLPFGFSSFRPDQVSLTRESSEDKEITTKLVYAEAHGADTIYRLESPLGPIMLRDPKPWQEVKIVEKIYLNPKNILFYDKSGKRIEPNIENKKLLEKSLFSLKSITKTP